MRSDSEREALDWVRDLRPDLAWPTVLGAAAVFGAYVTITTLALTGRLPGLPAAAANTVLVYLTYTPLHEACHGNIARRSGWRGRLLTHLVGLLASAPLLFNFPLHRSTHLAHHRHLNDPARDADHWVNGRHALDILWRCATVIGSHHVVAWRLNKGSRSGRRRLALGLAENALWIATLLALAATGHGRAVALVVLLPAFLGQVLLAFTFDWAVHHPYRAGSRFQTTTAFVPRRPAWAALAQVLTCGQNLHLVHHLYPWVPFYRYAKVMRHMGAFLRIQGARIIER